jgi:hypothetical protein
LQARSDLSALSLTNLTLPILTYPNSILNYILQTEAGHDPGPRHQEEEEDLASGVQAEEQDQRFRRQAHWRKSKIITIL